MNGCDPQKLSLKSIISHKMASLKKNKFEKKYKKDTSNKNGKKRYISNFCC